MESRLEFDGFPILENIIFLGGTMLNLGRRYQKINETNHKWQNL